MEVTSAFALIVNSAEYDLFRISRVVGKVLIVENGCST
jgi:hypothetical protein